MCEIPYIFYIPKHSLCLCLSLSFSLCVYEKSVVVTLGSKTMEKSRYMYVSSDYGTLEKPYPHNVCWVDFPAACKMYLWS